jgi:hypothetical protein
MTVAQERRKITAIPQKLSEDDCLNCAEGTGFVLLHAPRRGVNLVSNLRNG